jgi:hypothetical protein
LLIGRGHGRRGLCQPEKKAIGSPAGLCGGPGTGDASGHPAVPWEEGMKLSQAIVAAEYTAFMNPRLIRVLRDGQVAGEIKGIDLLHHADMELENGDTVLIVP